MSIEATLATWKLTKKQVTPTEKLFLLSCANRAGESHECWPSLKRLCADTGMDRKTLIKVRQSVIDKGFLVYTGSFTGRSKQIPIMQLTYVDNSLSEFVSTKHEPQFTGGVNHSSREGRTTVHPYNIDYKLDKNTNTPPYNPSSIFEPVDNSTIDNCLSEFTGTKNGTGTGTKNGTGDQSQNWDTESKRRNLKEDNNTSYSPPMEDVAKASQNHNQNQANEIEPTQKKPSKQKAQRTEEQDQLIRELIQCYNRVLSKHRVTKHLTNPIRKDVKNTLTNTIKQWNTHLTTKFTIEKFEAYLEHLAATKHWLITPYRNKSGNEVIKGIPLICNWESILRVKEDIEQEESNEN